MTCNYCHKTGAGFCGCAEYYRQEFGNCDCPACGATLDVDGRTHADGSKCHD